MAADTQMVQGTAVIGSFTKIARRDSDGALAGACGNAGFVAAFLEWFKGDGSSTPPHQDQESGDRGVIVDKTGAVKMFESSGSFDVGTGWFAIGSGKEFALGAMDVGASSIEAVIAATLRDPYSGGDVICLSHDQA
jgi:ATP-dependent HslUV protease subunit HslV